MAIRINKVYTKSGDRGKTSLIGGSRISKGEPRIEAYGTIDELNSLVGTARTWIDRGHSHLTPEVTAPLVALLQRIQNQLFDLGSLLAAPPEELKKMPAMLTTNDVASLEEIMDEYQPQLPELKSFVLPGGSMLNAFLHQGRTVARKAERIIVRLSESDEVPEVALQYINRLSDLLFVLSRYVAAQEEASEYLWEKGLR